jgi:hypothetical protein
MAPLWAVVVVLGAAPEWLPVTGLAGVSLSHDASLGVEAQALYQGGRPAVEGGVAHGVTFGVGLRGAYTDGAETRRLGAGLAARVGYALGDVKPRWPVLPLLHGWLQASVGVGHVAIKDAPLSPGRGALVPHGRLELGVSAPVVLAVGLPDLLIVFVEGAPTDPMRAWRAGVTVGLSF